MYLDTAGCFIIPCGTVDLKNMPTISARAPFNLVGGLSQVVSLSLAIVIAIYLLQQNSGYACIAMHRSLFAQKAENLPDI